MCLWASASVFYIGNEQFDYSGKYVKGLSGHLLREFLLCLDPNLILKRNALVYLILFFVLLFQKSQEEKGNCPIMFGHFWIDQIPPTPIIFTNKAR